MKKRYDYTMSMIDTTDAGEVLRVILQYGAYGWRFVSWFPPVTPLSDKLPNLTYAIFEREDID